MFLAPQFFGGTAPRVFRVGLKNSAIFRPCGKVSGRSVEGARRTSGETKKKIHHGQNISPSGTVVPGGLISARRPLPRLAHASPTALNDGRLPHSRSRMQPVARCQLLTNKHTEERTNQQTRRIAIKASEPGGHRGWAPTSCGRGPSTCTTGAPPLFKRNSQPRAPLSHAQLRYSSLKASVHAWK